MSFEDGDQGVAYAGGVRKLAVVFLLSLFLGGCAFGNKIQYRDEVALNLKANKEMSFVVGVLDKRPYVLSGKRSANFVGFMRSTYGIPFPITTKSGKSLAEDFAFVVTTSMRGNGYKTKLESLGFFVDNETTRTILFREKADRYILIELQQWKTDQYLNIALHHALTMKVFDQTGATLTIVTRQGIETIRKHRKTYDGLHRATPTTPKRNLHGAIEGIMNSLFHDEKVVLALSGSDMPITQPDPTGQCTAEQISEMKRVGLSDERIQAACGQ